MFPGFTSDSRTLIGPGYSTKLQPSYDPYNRDQLINQIGESIDQLNHEYWDSASQLLHNCKYKRIREISSPNSTELSIYSHNIRSLSKNINELRENSMTLASKFDLLCFNETNCNIDNLPNGIDDLTIEGFYDPLIKNPARKSNKGGGLAIYVNKKACALEEIDALDIKNDQPLDGEFQCVRIRNFKCTGKTSVIVNTYRSPSRKVDKYIENVENLLSKLDRFLKNKQVLIVGDFNIDLVKYEHDKNSQSLVETMENRGCAQLISRPTRITDHSSTLIDHIYTNNLCNIVSTSVLTTDMSDHLATYALVDLKSTTVTMSLSTSNANDSEFRLFNAANNETYREFTRNETWYIPNDLGANAKYDYLMDTYGKHYNNAYPLMNNRCRRKNERKVPKPWILPWLENACERKNKFYHIWIAERTIESKRRYERMKSFTEKHCTLARKKFMSKYFDEHKSNSRKQWQMINNLLSRKPKKRETIRLKDENGDIINDPSKVADRFIEHFANTPSNIKRTLQEKSNPDAIFEYMPKSAVNSIFLRTVDPSEIDCVIKDLENKATLDTRAGPLKVANENKQFSNSVADVVTTSFREGVFPEKLKMARVIPIHKGGVKTDVSNYRPISLLPIFSKIYEKLMHKRIMEYLDKYNILCENQYGFRSGRSCEHALLNAQHTVLDTLNNKKVALLLLIDYSKAFDLVEHTVILNKLYHYGIRGKAHEWFKSYLGNRKQFVHANGVDSQTRDLEYGVPQGSILGPLLFILYINDLPNISKLAKFILYADDANIFITGDSVNEVMATLNELSPILVSWVSLNGLKLNLKKTNFMIFSRNKKRHQNIPEVIIDGTVIEQKTEARFLGVIIDDKLSWSAHINAVRRKMTRYTGIMYRLKNQLPVKVRLQIYHSFVQCHLNYCSTVWGFSSKSLLDSLFRAQKRGIRAVMPGFVRYFYTDGEYPSHTKSCFNEYKIPTIYNLIFINSTLMMHRIFWLPSTLPPSIHNLISPQAPIVDDTMNDDISQWQKIYSGVVYQKSLSYKGPLLYLHKNQPKIDQKRFNNIKILRKAIKRSVIESQSSGDTHEWIPENNLLHNIKGLRSSRRINQ